MAKRKKKGAIASQKEQIHNFYKEFNDRIYTLNDLFNYLDVYDDDEKVFVKLILEDLVDEGKLVQVGRGRFALSEKNSEVENITGKVDFVNPKFAFIRYDDNESDVFVPADDLNGALDGDTVKVVITGKRRGGKNPEGRVVEILERGKNRIVGKVKVFANYALVKPDNKGFHEDVFVSKDKINEAKTNDLVIVEIESYPNGSIQASGKIIEILGQAGDNDAEMNAIMAEFGLPVKFPDDVHNEAEAISEVITPAEIKKRKDFRDTLTFTIDPADAKDFDDAISYKKLDNGNVEVGVHIADVSHYLQPGTRLEEEAYRRATSVYLVDRTIPMLPEKLSNNLCSLRPHEDKLVFSAVFEVNENAEVLREWFGRSIIHSDRRFSYEEAQEILEPDAPIDQKYTEVLNNLNRMAKVLRNERFNKGAFNFETNEVKFTLDEKGRPIGVYQKVRKDAHKLIEEFMLLANKRVAMYVYNLNQKTKAPEPFTMVYRVHEPPNPTKIDTFARFATKLGFEVKTNTNAQLSKSLNALMFKIEGTPMQNVLESLAVRTMSKARYSTANLGHFGLAFDHYSHFTSPIRRYPDVMAHRMLQHYLDGGSSLPEDDFESRCKHSSDMEKLASEAERASIKYKQVEYMSYMPSGTVFEGVVTGVTDFGLFAEIEDTGCEGMVRLADLTDDFYEYDADNYRVVGKRSNKIIGFGNKVKVKILATDLERRSMDLQLISVEGSSFKTSTNPTSNSRRSKNPGRADGKRSSKKRR
ncbi:MAG: ribonuclease R [Cytophagaceae bacterium]|nr:ribonuclease R [Cytophagaceae bacterium]MBK9933885.1 ribonuclease R [Cytophagaceae bacterium]MBL0302398.1 ribonuclease R [Cytophagaceae bacterium]MBL0325224.1 ribonuclease R [Cytophagaceae bacterium]